MLRSVTTFVQDSLVDLRQVRWPTRQQAIRLSVIVIAFTLASTVIFGAVDFSLSALLKNILALAA
jgi:preprotein translocase subunit SecE